MKLVPFIAENANAALAQVQARLGPDAVVVSVRKLPAHGISRLWNRGGQIEVLACAPEAEPEVQSPKSKVHAVPTGVDAYVPFVRENVSAMTDATLVSRQSSLATHQWPSIAWLESLGLLGEFADELEKKVSAIHGEAAPPMPIAEWHAVRDCLASFWRPARQNMECTGRPHVFIGPPGSGKTTVLCKWMTQAVLMQERNVKVWRLDGISANTAEFLTLHAEMLGLHADRFWNPPAAAADLFFVDLPGVESRDTHALAAMRDQIHSLSQPHIHLVLNAAYDTAVLFEQLHAFAPFAPEDLIFTHLDEERQRVKLWNFVLGARSPSNPAGHGKNFPISFLSAGQKIPGDFCRAESGLLFPRKTPNK